MKIFVFDLDGTLLVNDVLSSQMLHLLQKANEKHILVFATSRSLRGIQSVLPDTLLNDSIQILCNGAFAIFHDKQICSTTISLNDLEKFYSTLNSHKIQYYFELGNRFYVPPYGKHSFYNQLKSEAPNELLTNLTDDNKRSVYKISILDKLDSNNIEILNDLSPTLQYYKYSDGTIDIISSNVSKWTCLKNIQKTLFNKEFETIAFGNDSNDYDMLNSATLSFAIDSNHEIFPPECIMLKDSHYIEKLLSHLI